MSKSKKMFPSPYSLRFTPEERARLDKDSEGMSLAAYIRSRLFDDSLPKRRTRNTTPVKDYELLAKFLGEFQRSRLANNHNQLAKAVNMGALPVTPETEKAIQRGCTDIRVIRLILIKALGLKVGDES